MNNVETIFISEHPMPFNSIGSWTVMYSKLLKNKNPFDYIICPEPDIKMETKYSILENQTTLNKINNKLFGSDRFSNYFDALKKIVDNSDKKYVLHIVDNAGLVIPLNNFIKTHFDRRNFYIQYSYHGFDTIYNKTKGTSFFSCIDEMFFLTDISYKVFLNYYNEFTPKVRILHNGVNSNQFKLLDNKLKENIKKEHDLENKIIFMWCSQDRPKKGLDFILEVWKDVYSKYKDRVVLLIIGTNRKINLPGVMNVGRVSNDLLPKYYQISDVYLFPSLWKEGFGIVLAEALKCGCYCIASKQGGIPEVLQYGKLGLLIERPNIIDNWIGAINNTIGDFSTKNKEEINKTIDLKSLYDFDVWCNNITLYIEKAKESLSSKSLMF